MEIIKKKVTELIPATFNPRTISVKAYAGLKTSIKSFGLVEPIIWNKKSGNVVGGHQRLKVLLEQGVKETDVVVVDLSEDKEKALNVALNNKYIAGDWTGELGDLLGEIKTDLPELFNDLNLDCLLPDVPDILPPIEQEPEEEGEKVVICPQCGFEIK